MFFNKFFKNINLKYSGFRDCDTFEKVTTLFPLIL